MRVFATTVLGVTEQKTVEVPQLQLYVFVQVLDKVVHMPVVVYDSAVLDVPVVLVDVVVSSSWTRLLTCPLVCHFLVLSAENCGVLRSCSSSTTRAFCYALTGAVGPDSVSLWMD